MKEVLLTEFETEALIRSMTPMDIVIDSFQSTYQPDECKRKSINPPSDNSVPTYFREEAQGAFAAIINNIIHLPDGNQAAFQPTTRYIRKLLQRYASIVEKYTRLENEHFAELMMEYQFRTSEEGGDMPDPNASCHVSYIVPFDENFHENQDEICQRGRECIVGIKVFPHHNDVGVRKVWEAGAALAEYLIERPELVRGKTVCELGAGVGLTGIVISGLCQTKSVHLTDYTEASLVNMEHNVKVNTKWVKNARHEMMDTVFKAGQPVTSGYLEWEQFSEGVLDNAIELPNVSESIHQTEAVSMEIAKRAQVLIAADVVYDRTFIPPLVSSVGRLLSESSERIAIFAITYRNEKTFALFDAALNQAGIKCNYAPRESTEKMNYIFPCYVDQPREDVRICTMSMTMTTQCNGMIC